MVPQSNGSIERSHHVLMEYLKNFITKDYEWDQHIAQAMFSYNTSVHEGTQYSPYQLVFGRLPRIPSAHLPIEEETNETYQQYLTFLTNCTTSRKKLERTLSLQKNEANDTMTNVSTHAGLTLAITFFS